MYSIYIYLIITSKLNNNNLQNESNLSIIKNLCELKKNYLKVIEDHDQFDHIKFYLMNKLNHDLKSKLNNCTVRDKFYLKRFFKRFIENKNDKIIPFWNDRIALMSKNLFIPCKKNLIKDKNNFPRNTWFKSEFLKANFDLLHTQELNYISIPPPSKKITKTKSKKKITKKRTLEENEIIKVRKIILYPNKIQAQILRKMLGIIRYFYNRAISVMSNYKKETRTSYYYIDYKNEETKIIITVPINQTVYDFSYLRSILKTNFPAWFVKNDIQSHTIDLTIKEAVDQYIINLNKIKIYGGKFTMKKKTKKDLLQTMNIEKLAINNNTIFSGFRYNKEKIFDKLKMSEKLSKYNYCGSSLSYHRILNKFILNLNYTTKKVITKANKICSIDPGVVNFLAIYSDSKVAKIGIKTKDAIYKICNEIDIISSRLNRYSYKSNNKYVENNGKIIKEDGDCYIVNHNRRRNLKRSLHRKIDKLKNMKRELHDQAINYLTSNYSKIIVPPFKIQKMAGKLSSKTARMMYNLSYYTFKCKLQRKGIEKNCLVEIKNEHYTSKTCTRCGNIKSDLNLNDRIYKCSNCKLTIDRDYLGARNILLRNNN